MARRVESSALRAPGQQDPGPRVAPDRLRMQVVAALGAEAVGLDMGRQRQVREIGGDVQRRAQVSFGVPSVDD